MPRVEECNWRVPDCELLTPKEERELGRRVRAGDEAARQEMVERNLPLAMWVARRVRRYAGGMGLDDMAQAGVLGLYRAVDRFDPGREVRFNTYATYWIYQTIRRELIRNGGLVRVPDWAVIMAGRATRAIAAMPEGAEATPEQIAMRLGTTPSKVRICLAGRRKVKLDSQRRDAWGDAGLAGVLSHHAGPLDEAHDADCRESLGRAIDSLTPRHADAIRRMVLSGHTLREFGADHGFTRERARQIKNEAIALLRRRLNA